MSSKNTKPSPEMILADTPSSDIDPTPFANEPPDPEIYKPDALVCGSPSLGASKQETAIPQFRAHVAGLFYDPHDVIPIFNDLLHAMARASSLETITRLQTVHGIDLLKEMKRLRRLRSRLEDAMIEDAANEQLSD